MQYQYNPGIRNGARGLAPALTRRKTPRKDFEPNGVADQKPLTKRAPRARPPPERSIREERKEEWFYSQAL